MIHDRDQRGEGGFTLIELLIAIVVVGILTAVAIVGIAGLTNSGKAASCQTTIDAARAAAIHNNNNNSAYPSSFGEMVTAKELVLQGGVTDNGGDLTTAPPTPQLSANGWTITLGANGVLSATGAVGCQ